MSLRETSSAGISEMRSVPTPPPPDGLRQSLRLQIRVVRALMLREMLTRFGRLHLGYVWAFLQPLLHIAVWFFIRIIIRARGGTADMSPWLFLGAGIVPFLMFMNVGGFVRGSIKANQALIAFPPVKSTDTIISRFLLESITMIAVGIFVFALLITFGEAGWPDSITLLAAVSLGMLLLGLGYGLVMSIANLFFPSIGQLSFILTRFLYLGSGIFYNPDDLPPEVLKWLSWNPCLHGVQLFRHGYSELYTTTVSSLTYLFTVAAVLILMGLFLERATRHRLRDLP